MAEKGSKGRSSFLKTSLDSPILTEQIAMIMFSKPRLITLIVGPKKDLLYVQEGILQHIPYFSDYLKQDSKTSLNQYELPDESLKAVQTTLTWLLQGFPLYHQLIAKVETLKELNKDYSMRYIGKEFATEFFNEMGGAALFQLAHKWGLPKLELAACRMVFTVMRESYDVVGDRDALLLYIYKELRATRHRYLPLAVLMQQSSKGLDNCMKRMWDRHSGNDVITCFWRELSMLKGLSILNHEFQSDGEQDFIDQIVANDRTSVVVRTGLEILNV